MDRDRLNRRQFHQLSAAALGGMLAGTAVGCGDKAAPPAQTDAPPAGSAPKTTATGAAPVVAAANLHACRGLNECKGQGRDKKNNCAGQGNCYTVSHECAGQNDCKYQGGCGGKQAMNDCKEKGGCGHFPIEDQQIWKAARAAFEGRMKTAGKKVGAPPAVKA